ncbi:ornithine carbamoyltransferase [Candidatus Magnetobacterium bavaricum]|uniref:Ornithine carbamoyltransferase n=1 Tax=Candidatus Magnetobacterium bavaricum TaxID=29290 RepID=A0A0F3H012_9BACT|nr:ornithine carbamoyltransferase [Candidatus Magnetobacterium bavaricum]
MKRDFLRVLDLSSPECERLIDRAIELKSSTNSAAMPLSGKTVGLLFEKSSTRTRVSLEVGVYQLGGYPVYLNQGDTQMGRGESIADTARVLSRYLDAVAIRTYKHEGLVEFAQHATIPVINALSDSHHPCQIMADLMTIKEKKGALTGVRLTYVGDGNNVANSLIEAACLMGISLTVACPAGFEPDIGVMTASKDADIRISHCPEEAVRGTDVIYTDVWVSMGDKVAAAEKKEKFRGFQVNDNLLLHARPDTLIMHCLPAHRGEEITSPVLDGTNSVVFEQAENRLHTQKAILELLIK